MMSRIRGPRPSTPNVFGASTQDQSFDQVRNADGTAAKKIMNRNVHTNEPTVTRSHCDCWSELPMRRPSCPRLVLARTCRSDVLRPERYYVPGLDARES